MSRRGYSCALALFLLANSAACTTQCIPSSDIQVSVLPDDPALDPARISKLHVALSINGSIAKSLVITLPAPLDRQGSAFILRPDTAPMRSLYQVSVTIEALDGNNQLYAIGSDSQQVQSKGCNQMTTRLFAFPGNMPSTMSHDMSAGSGPGPKGDMMGMHPPDLAGCFGGMPDEDNDGRANWCDLCPADYDPTPVDNDGDGLPDACDPDPAKAGNMLTYFDPFDTMSGHWSGNFTVAMSSLAIDSSTGNINTPISVPNLADRPPLNVRVQTYVLAPFILGSSNSPLAVAALFLGDGSDPFAPTTNGVVCQIRFDELNGSANANDSIRLQPVVKGVLQAGTSTPTPNNCSVNQPLPPPPEFCFSTNTLYRLRLTQRGNVYSCEVVVDGTDETYAPASITVTPPGPTQFIVLQEENLRAEFHSVVVETALP